jgi:3',5'-cyclic AMP phosphodiesterase CpdA
VEREVTTVADDLIVVHADGVAHRRDGLAPDTEHEVGGVVARTMPAPPGRLLSRIATVNDLHFGEVECGRIDSFDIGPIERVGPGETPYPWTMNAGAAAEIAATMPDLVVVKGDVTSDGTDGEWAAFRRCYAAVADRTVVVRGNHDAYRGQHDAAGDRYVELPGVSIALLDTVVPGDADGALGVEQLERLDEHARGSDRPLLVMGHHPLWSDAGGSDDHFGGLDRGSSEALAAVVARRPAIVAYAAGHTHRHRVRLLPCGAPGIEVGCVKDFPGTWAEYRVHEGAILQVVHRVSTPEALAWSERCRHLYRDFGLDYASYALGTLADRCFRIGLR